MATQPITRLTPEQYLELDRAGDCRSEYLNGEMFAMSGATFRHNTVVNNIASALRGQIKGRCRYATTDLRLFIPATGLYTYPDLIVICGAIEYAGDREDIVTNPGLIVEVLSRSTSDYDRGGKFVHYRSLPTLRDYVTAAQDAPCVEHWTRRTDGSWLLREYSALTDTVSIESIAVRLPLSDIYEEIAFNS